MWKLWSLLIWISSSPPSRYAGNGGAYSFWRRAVTRVSVFIDYENLRFGAREVFGDPRRLSPRTPRRRTRIRRRCSKQGSALLRRGDELKDADHARLDKLFAEHPDSKPAGSPSTNSTASTSPTTKPAPCKPSAGSATSTPPANTCEFHKIVDTIIAWSDEILAPHHTNRASNGRIDRTNKLYPSPTTNRPRLHPPHQLRRPKNHDNMTPNRQQQP